jgi:hypothetical protein
MQNALVISGGGAKGAFAVGVIQKLLAEFPILNFDIVVGTSTGSLIAPLAIAGEYDLLRQLYTTVKTEDIIVKDNIGNRLGMDCIFEAGPLWNLMKKYYTDDLISRIMGGSQKLFLTTTCLQTGELVVFTNDAAMQMKIAIDSDVLLGTFNQGAATNQGATAGKISASFNLGTDLAPVTLTAANILQSITALSSVLDEANVPETDRFLVISPTERQILMQSNLAQAQFMGDPSSILRNGKIGQIDRFTVYVSNLLPRAAAGQSYTGTVVSNALKRHAIMAGHKSAITFASQIAKVESLQNPNDFGTLIRGLNVYGYKVVQADGLALLQAAG